MRGHPRLLLLREAGLFFVQQDLLLRGEWPVGIEGFVGEVLDFVEASAEDFLDVVVVLGGDEEELSLTVAPQCEEVGVVEENVGIVGVVGAPDEGGTEEVF